MSSSSATVRTSRLQNTSGGTRYFGYLPSHGVTLADKEIFEVDGDLIESVRSVRGPRHVTSLLADLAAGDASLFDGDEVTHNVPRDSTTVIAVGDLLYLAAGKALPFSSQADAGSLLLNQAAAKDAFLGVARTAHASGNTADVQVAPDGMFEISCASTTWTVGDLVGAVEVATNDALEAQKVAKVAESRLAIARCVRSAAAATTVLMEVQSTVFDGGDSLNQVLSGTYTPTLTNVTNAAASSIPSAWQFTRIGNVVSFAGAVSATPTAGSSAATEVGISLPLASDLAAAGDCAGAAVSGSAVGSGQISGDATNNRAALKFLAPGTTPIVFYVSGSYIVK